MDKKDGLEFLKKSVLEFKKAMKHYKTSIKDNIEHKDHQDSSNMTHITNRPAADLESDKLSNSKIVNKKPSGEGSPAPAMLKQDNMMGAGDVNTVSAGASAAMKSDEEPHKDDPHHEEKEKKIAEKIKTLAEKQLKMHKSTESVRIDSNGQWTIEKSEIESQ